MKALETPTQYVDIPPEKVAQALEQETDPKLKDGLQRLLLAILKAKRQV